MQDQPPTYDATRARFTGFGKGYDDARPTTPPALADLLSVVSGCQNPELVVDLGSGTGLSTRYWSDRAKKVIGVEPTDSMREQAEAVAKQTKVSSTDISYLAAYAQDTGLPTACADFVTCAQALHWMEPQPTFAEAARILKEGGVFAAYDYDWPPSTSSWQVEQAYTQCVALGHDLEKKHRVSEGLAKWDKELHLSRMQASGYFRYTRECLLHHEDIGNAERLIALLLSQGHIQTLLKAGFTETDLRIDQLRELADKELGSSPSRWFWSVRVRLGVK